MDGATLVERVRENRRTELERLGSDKVLLALTGANLETTAVLQAIGTRIATLETTLRAWTETEDDDTAREAFATAAESAREQSAAIATALDAPLEPADDELATYLRERETTVGRVGAGLVGSSLVLDRFALQVVNFFVNEADEHRANQFRDIRSTVDDRLATGEDCLDAVCATDEEWERASDAAEQVIRLAYDDYVASLDAMGLDPKPVC